MTTPEQIANECDALRELLMAKNVAYGDSAGASPVLLPNMDASQALFVRMSDKISRIRSLLQGADDAGESLDDSIRDLAGYCVLYLVSKNRG